MNRTRRVLVLAWSFPLWAPAEVRPQQSPAPIEASFDCTKASSAIEKAICSDAALAAADRQLAAVYRKRSGALEAARRRELKAEQAGWLKARDAACTAAADVVACLSQQYAVRLEALDPAGPTLRTLEGKPLSGPFASIEELCQKTMPDVDCGSSDPGSLEFEEWNSATSIPGVQPPYEAVRILASYCDKGEERSDCSIATYHLAIRTAKGWFLLSDLGESTRGAGTYQGMEVERFELGDFVPGAAPELVLVTEQTGSSTSAADSTYGLFSGTSLRICGIGASGHPSCAEPVPVAASESLEAVESEDEPDRKFEGLYSRAWRATYGFLPDGRLRVQTEEGAPEAEAEPFLGILELRFP